MRILLITGSFPPDRCGVGDYVERLAGALAAVPGVEVGVLTGGAASPQLPDRPYPVFHAMKRWSSKEARRLVEVVREFKPDVAHVQFPTLGYHGKLPWYLPLMIPVRTGVPVVQTWHEYYPEVPGPTWRDFAMLLAWRHVIVVRPEFRQHMPWWYRLLSAHLKFHLIPTAPSLAQVRLDRAARNRLKTRWAGDRNLVLFFGFPYEHKGIDDLMQAIDPAMDFLLVVGDLKDWDPYQVRLADRIQASPWKDCMRLSGFLPDDEAASLLAAADAVALPLRGGAGFWNTSLLSAQLQGSFVLTTAHERHGYDADSNTYWARPGDVADLRAGLRAHLGTRLEPERAGRALPSWTSNAMAHCSVYANHVSR
jgi:glycosyltransferase involved in cell wall biosynthesis